MKRLIPLLAAVLLLVGCAGRASEPAAGLKVTVEAGNIYSLSCRTEYSTEVGQNADNSPLAAGSSLYFNPGEGESHYTVSAQNASGATLAMAQFSSDLSHELVELVVTADGEIIRL